MDFGGAVVYQGSFQHGQKHGKIGSEQFGDGSRYNGAYKYGVPDGYGTWYGCEERPYAAKVRKESYVGEWKDGKKHGKGEWITFGGTYIGLFECDMPHGACHYVSADGMETYTGCWRCGLKHGEGVWEGRNGTRYVGAWLENWHHGKGSYTNGAGETLRGIFVRGLLEGKGEVVHSSGNGGYRGNLKHSLYHGLGTLIGSTSPLNKYVGHWFKGKRNGNGEQGYENGGRYIGEWFENQYHGEGEWYGCDGNFLNVYRGQFSYGRPHGHGAMRWNDTSGPFEIFFLFSFIFTQYFITS